MEKQRKLRETPRTKSEVDDEVQAFWILFAITSGAGRQPFRDYYGVPKRRLGPSLGWCLKKAARMISGLQASMHTRPF